MFLTLALSPLSQPRGRYEYHSGESLHEQRWHTRVDLEARTASTFRSLQGTVSVLSAGE